MKIKMGKINRYAFILNSTLNTNLINVKLNPVRVAELS